MYKRKLVLGTSREFELPFKEQLELFAKTGFEGAFLGGFINVDVEEYANTLKGLNMDFQSIHAPFDKMDAIWEEDNEKADDVINVMLNGLEICKKYNVPIMVMHTIIGMDKHTPNQMGIDRLGRIIKAAEGSGVKIAFENTEGIEYLHAVMNAFTDNNTVGFCWDSGHEMCYNFSEDLLAVYGERLIATHLNDNLGIKDFEGKNITWHDDLHLLPLDGIANWQYNMDRLNKCGFNGPLTFELCRFSKPNRYDNDKYAKMPIEEYIAEVYSRACKLANM